MKTTNIIIGALVLCTMGLTAQSEKKPVTVRMKKVENINGVEKITDTTYTTTDVTTIPGGDTKIRIIEGDDTKGKLIIIDSETGEGSASEVKVLKKGEGMDAEIEKALKEAGVDPNLKGTTQMIMINEDSKNSENKGEKKMMKIVVIKAQLIDANSTECKKAGISESKSKLMIEDMNCTPNPSNGKFNLRFSSPDKSSADISVRDINGKIVYSETVKDFSGSYDKQIDLDSNAKGIYFVTITQSKKATTKKLVVE